MRALLSRSLYALVGVVLLVFFVVPSIAQESLPRPIGLVSDYGSVLDRHGRERLEALIADARASVGIDVYILATWENPMPTVETLAESLLSAWDLDGRSPALLAVFLKTDSRWEHAIIGNAALPGAHLPAQLASSTKDLVDHNRIEEAMVQLVERLVVDRDTTASSSSSETAASTDSTSPRQGWAIPTLILSAALLIWIVHRRLCPRCGRLLRMRRDAMGRQSDRVYFCRACGYSKRLGRLRR